MAGFGRIFTTSLGLLTLPACQQFSGMPNMSQSSLPKREPAKEESYSSYGAGYQKEPLRSFTKEQLSGAPALYRTSGVTSLSNTQSTFRPAVVTEASPAAKLQFLQQDKGTTIQSNVSGSPAIGNGAVVGGVKSLP